MQAALEAAVAYTRERQVFGRALADLELTRVRIARMAWLLAACRAFAFHAAGSLGAGDGQLEASQVKQFACRAAEWVTRERRSSSTAATATPRSTRSPAPSSTPGCCPSSRAPMRCSPFASSRPHSCGCTALRPCGELEYDREASRLGGARGRGRRRPQGAESPSSTSCTTSRRAPSSTPPSPPVARIALPDRSRPGPDECCADARRLCSLPWLLAETGRPRPW